MALGVQHEWTIAWDEIGAACAALAIASATSATARSKARKTYGDVVAVDRVDLDIHEDEFFTLLGPSRSGKTTCLRMIAGFERPDERRVEPAGRDVTDLPPYERDVNTVFQDLRALPL
jgi:putative spermidine/putrescine transport system ATP-binding protein